MQPSVERSRKGPSRPSRNCVGFMLEGEGEEEGEVRDEEDEEDEEVVEVEG